MHQMRDSEAEAQAVAKPQQRHLPNESSQCAPQFPFPYPVLFFSSSLSFYSMLFSCVVTYAESSLQEPFPCLSVWPYSALWPLSSQMPSAAMAPLVENSHPKGLPNLPLLTHRACTELQAAAIHHLKLAEAWMHQVGASIVSRNSALEQFVQQVGDFKVGVQVNRGGSSQRLAVRGNRNFAAIIPGDSVAEMVISSSVFNFLNIYNTILIARLVLTWFPSAPEAIVNPLSTICDPYLNVFRGIIPPLGTLDLSPILAFTVLNVFTSTAQALPAELDSKPREKLGWRQLAQRRKGLKGAPLSK